MSKIICSICRKDVTHDLSDCNCIAEAMKLTEEELLLKIKEGERNE